MFWLAGTAYTCVVLNMARQPDFTSWRFWVDRLKEARGLQEASEASEGASSGSHTGVSVAPTPTEPPERDGMPCLVTLGSSPLGFAPCLMVGLAAELKDPTELSIRFHGFWTQQCERYTGSERLSRLRRGVSAYARMGLEPMLEHWAR